MSYEEYLVWREGQKDLFLEAGKHAPKNPVIFDIGAHHGQSAEIFRELYPDAKIVCFEPLVTEVARDKCNEIDADLIQCAISNEYGSAVINVTEFDQCSSLLHKGTDHDWGSLTDPVGSENVTTIRLDDWCKDNDCWPDIIKVDTQGSEADVIEGGEKAFFSCSVAIVEEILINAYAGQRPLPIEGKFHVHKAIPDEGNTQRDLIISPAHAGLGNSLLDMVGSMLQGLLPQWSCCNPATLFKPHARFIRAEPNWERFMPPSIGEIKDLTQPMGEPPYECWMFKWLEDPDQIKRTYNALWSAVMASFKTDILLDMTHFVNEHQPTVGWQIRSWDEANERIKVGELPPPPAGAFVTSDKDIEGDYLQYPRTTPRNRTPEAIREDLIELLILATCHDLTITEMSTFGEAAWWLGGCTENLTTINAHKFTC